MLKRIKIGDKSKLVPRKMFVYQSIVQTILRFCARPRFLERCNSWRYANNEDQVLSDIYDCRVWKELHSIEGEPFLSLPNNLCLALNVDWFNPYKQTPYSVGAMYLSILNLPRSERFKMHNIILVGMIPGPNEPSNLNPFLGPLISNLSQLFTGVFVRLQSNSSLPIKQYWHVSSVTSQPHENCVNFNAIKGCSKCLKEFPTSYFGYKLDTIWNHGVSGFFAHTSKLLLQH